MSSSQPKMQGIRATSAGLAPERACGRNGGLPETRWAAGHRPAAHPPATSSFPFLPPEVEVVGRRQLALEGQAGGRPHFVSSLVRPASSDGKAGGVGVGVLAEGCTRGVLKPEPGPTPRPHRPASPPRDQTQMTRLAADYQLDGDVRSFTPRCPFGSLRAALAGERPPPAPPPFHPSADVPPSRLAPDAKRPSSSPSSGPPPPPPSRVPPPHSTERPGQAPLPARPGGPPGRGGGGAERASGPQQRRRGPRSWGPTPGRRRGMTGRTPPGGPRRRCAARAGPPARSGPPPNPEPTRSPAAAGAAD